MTSLAKGVIVRIDKFGAIGDGNTVNTTTIQKAIDYCSKEGGGKVLFPAGKWVSGTILLKSGVTLSLDAKAVILGSVNIEDYYIVDGFRDGTGQEMGYCFIGAVDVKNAGIEGKGIIDGRGKAVLASGGKNKRPFLLRFVRCEAITVSDVHLQGSAAWTVHLFHCRNVKAERLTIKSRGLPNNDGIDIDCCGNVKINDCDIDSGDDAICFKTTSPFPCENISISNIRVRTNCAAIKLGTESAGDFRNINVNHIKVAYAGLGAIKIFSVDGSHISNINISDVDADSVNLPVMMRLGARLKVFRPEDNRQETGTIKNVRIKKVNVNHATTAGILISGIPGHFINGVIMEDLVIRLNGGGSGEDSKVRFEEKIAAYPEVRMFGRIIPAYGMYVRHAAGLSFKNITISTNVPDARQAIFVSDVKDLLLDTWSLPVDTSSEPMVNLENTQNIKAVNFSVNRQPSLFMNIEGKDSKAISVSSPFISAELIKINKDVSPESVTISQK